MRIELLLGPKNDVVQGLDAVRGRLAFVVKEARKMIERPAESVAVKRAREAVLDEGESALYNVDCALRFLHEAEKISAKCNRVLLMKYHITNAGTVLRRFTFEDGDLVEVDTLEEAAEKAGVTPAEYLVNETKTLQEAEEQELLDMVKVTDYGQSIYAELNDEFVNDEEIRLPIVTRERHDEE